MVCWNIAESRVLFRAQFLITPKETASSYKVSVLHSETYWQQMYRPLDLIPLQQTTDTTREVPHGVQSFFSGPSLRHFVLAETEKIFRQMSTPAMARKRTTLGQRDVNLSKTSATSNSAFKVPSMVVNAEYETGSAVREEIKQKAQLAIRNRRLSERYFLTSMNLINTLNTSGKRERRLAMDRLKYMENLHIQSVETKDLDSSVVKAPKRPNSAQPRVQCRQTIPANYSNCKENPPKNPKRPTSELKTRPLPKNPAPLSKPKERSALSDLVPKLSQSLSTKPEENIGKEKEEKPKKVIRSRRPVQLVEETNTNVVSEVSTEESNIVPQIPPTSITTRVEKRTSISYNNHIGSTSYQGCLNTQFNCPSDVKVCSKHGVFLVADTSNSRVQIFNTDLQYSRSVKIPSPNFLSVSCMDDSVVVSSLEKFVCKFNISNGNIIWETNNSEIKCPQGVAVDNRTGDIFVCDNELNKVFTLNTGGDITNSIQLDFSPHSIEVDALGNMVIVDKKNGSIKKISLDGQSVPAFSCTDVHLPNCSCIDPTSGNIFVSEVTGRVLLIRGEDGSVLEKFGSKGNYYDNFDNPKGLSIHKDQILVADCNNHRIIISDIKQ